MKIIIKAKNLEISGDLQKFIDERIGSLNKFINILKDDSEQARKTLAEVFVELDKETGHHKKGHLFTCQLEVRLPGRSLMARSRSDSLEKAIIEAKKELKQEIEKYKFKNVTKHRRLQRKTKREIKL